MQKIKRWYGSENTINGYIKVNIDCLLHNQQISYSYRSNQDGNNDNNQQQPIVLKSEKPSLMIENNLR